MQNAPLEMDIVKPEDSTPSGGKSKKKKDNKAETVKNLVSIIDGFSHIWGKFPRKFLIVRDKAGHALWLERDHRDMVWASSISAVAETLQKYLAEKKPTLSFPHHEIKNICELWALQTKNHKLDDIAIVQQKSEKGLTWHRLDFDFAEGPCPTWDEILGRMENAQAFLAWFGSLFDARSDRAQYIWLSGSGDNSKGTIIDMLAHIFGKDRGFKSAEPWDKRPGQFWKRMILGSRIVCFPECNDPKFVTTEGFKSLTGDSFHSLDGKFSDIFTAELNCKFLIASNERAEISGEWSERKRLIPCHMEEIKRENFLPKSLLYPKLIQELPAFCHKALSYYKKACPNGDRIVPDEGITDAWVESTEEKYQALIDKYFIVAKDGELTLAEMHDFRTHEGVRMYDNREFGKFKKFLFRSGVRRYRPMDGLKKRVVYKGISKSAYFERVSATYESTNVTATNGHGPLNGGSGPSDETTAKALAKKRDDMADALRPS